MLSAVLGPIPLTFCRSLLSLKATAAPWLLRYATIAPARLGPSPGNLARLSTEALFGFIRLSNSMLCCPDIESLVLGFDAKPQQKAIATNALITNAKH